MDAHRHALFQQLTPEDAAALLPLLLIPEPAPALTVDERIAAATAELNRGDSNYIKAPPSPEAPPTS